LKRLKQAVQPKRRIKKRNGMNMTVLGFVTTKDAKEAERIANILIENGLAACCNIVPSVKSIYRWKNNIERSNESLIIIKTKKELAEKAVKKIKTEHSYDMPAIEFIDISDGNPDSIEWIKAVTKKAKEK
jgi:periplasmic divalent cation tolerance protein